MPRRRAGNYIGQNLIFGMRDGFILTINAGSSSLKFALFLAEQTPVRKLTGKFERIGLKGGKLTITDVTTRSCEERPFDAATHTACVAELEQVLGKSVSMTQVRAVAHRIVHGGPRYSKPQRVSRRLLEELRRIRSFDPDHMPAELGLVKHFTVCYPRVPQIACFDTAFHRDLPRVARILPIPRRYEARGVQRYGFHGLSFSYLMQQLKRDSAAIARGRIILAHLGNGASMAAVYRGRSIDTTMAFTPTAGLVMSTRSGDLDPGLASYFARSEGMSPHQFHEMVHGQSGLLGISETSSDVRDLLAREKKDIRAAEALQVFCYQARKWIGALTAALGGLDLLVFSGGIGENSPEIRQRICQGLAHLGVQLDGRLNVANATVITKKSSQVIVRVIPTDEELYMAQTLSRMIR